MATSGRREPTLVSTLRAPIEQADATRRLAPWQHRAEETPRFRSLGARHAVPRSWPPVETTRAPSEPRPSGSAWLTHQPTACSPPAALPLVDWPSELDSAGVRRDWVCSWFVVGKAGELLNLSLTRAVIPVAGPRAVSKQSSDYSLPCTSASRPPTAWEASALSPELSRHRGGRGPAGSRLYLDNSADWSPPRAMI